MATHYDVLQVNKDASVEVIHAAYRALMKKYHPDNQPNPVVSPEVIARVQEAHRVLSNEQLREEYDRCHMISHKKESRWVRILMVSIVLLLCLVAVDFLLVFFSDVNLGEIQEARVTAAEAAQDGSEWKLIAEDRLGVRYDSVKEYRKLKSVVGSYTWAANGSTAYDNMWQLNSDGTALMGLHQTSNVFLDESGSLQHATKADEELVMMQWINAKYTIYSISDDGEYINDVIAVYIDYPGLDSSGLTLYWLYNILDDNGKTTGLRWVVMDSSENYYDLVTW